MTESPDPKPQSLWNVMKRAGLTASTAETFVRVSDDDHSTADPPKGLWKVMGLAVAPRPVDAEISHPSPAASQGTLSQRAVPSREKNDDAPGLDVVTDENRFPHVEPPKPRSRQQSDASSRGLASFSQVSSAPGGLETDMPFPAAVGSQKLVPKPRSPYNAWKHQSHEAALRNGWMTLAVGLGGLVTSSLSYFENFWFRIPATCLGLIALVMGLMALSATARKQEEQRIKIVAGIGMAFGLLGMFMGPLVFSGWGARARQEAAVADSRYHLEEVGYAINRYHAVRGRFPAGGTFIRRPDGTEQGMHGWMTHLLPYIGKADLYSMVDFDKPYDDPANFAVFSQDVPTFYASGGDRAKIGRGFAVAHFAGVGGTMKDDKGRTIDLGAFGSNSDVRRAQITDGASNTPIVGEVGYGYAAWGEPENWRTVGKGLNREPVGFGNAQDSGAVFLFADGSVKFFANNTDPKVLEQLSTRNGADNAGR